jgi:hypothetical protein
MASRGGGRHDSMGRCNRRRDRHRGGGDSEAPVKRNAPCPGAVGHRRASRAAGPARGASRAMQRRTMGGQTEAQPTTWLSPPLGSARHWAGRPLGPRAILAEREGFEPSVPFRIHMISNHAPSAARSPLLGLPMHDTMLVTQTKIESPSGSAERVGVEPTVPLRIHLISNQAPSATRSSLRGGLWQRRSFLSTLEAARATQIGRRSAPGSSRRAPPYGARLGARPGLRPCRGRSRRRARSGGSAPGSGLRRTAPRAPHGRWRRRVHRTRRAPRAPDTTS